MRAPEAAKPFTAAEKKQIDASLLRMFGGPGMPVAMPAGGGGGGLPEASAFRKQLEVASGGLGGLALTLGRTAIAGAALIGIPVSLAAAVQSFKKFGEELVRLGERLTQREIGQIPLGAMAPGSSGKLTRESEMAFAQWGYRPEEVSGLAMAAQQMYGREGQEKELGDARRVMAQLKRFGVPDESIIKALEAGKQAKLTPVQTGALIRGQSDLKSGVDLTTAEYAAISMSSQKFKDPFVAAGVLRALRGEEGEPQLFLKGQLEGAREGVGGALWDTTSKFGQKMQRAAEKRGLDWTSPELGDWERLQLVGETVDMEKLRKRPMVYGLEGGDAKALERVLSRMGQVREVAARAGSEKRDVLWEDWNRTMENDPEMRRAIAQVRAQTMGVARYEQSPEAIAEQRKLSDDQFRAEQIRRSPGMKGPVARYLFLDSEKKNLSWTGRKMFRQIPLTGQKRQEMARAWGMEDLLEPAESGVRFTLPMPEVPPAAEAEALPAAAGRLPYAGLPRTRSQRAADRGLGGGGEEGRGYAGLPRSREERGADRREAADRDFAEALKRNAEATEKLTGELQKRGSGAPQRVTGSSGAGHYVGGSLRLRNAHS
jgi:hypothetical protein